eukprot:TRINITY_DN65445_c0_g1_i1.p1 TRINITY_DN65445_c0_g1~~TRINITY_DN65445_c0_g1_i1.p1  ORF type:complete len:391 (+),score=90.56 TRINITY_DN65445_c0_g1_i1:268-1440(+)
MGADGSKESGAEAQDKCGLENFGNTCYVNAVMQALFWCEPFRNSLLNYCEQLLKEAARVKYTSSRSVGSEGGAPVNTRMASEIHSLYESSLISSVHRLFLQLLNLENRKRVSTKANLKALIRGLRSKFFAPYQQQDAHEMLTNLLSDLTETVRKIEEIRMKYGAAPKSKPSSIKSFVEHSFEGFFAAETKCLTCEERTFREEEFLSMSVDVSQNVSLHTAIRNFAKGEMLNSDNKFYCNACRSLQEARRSMRLHRPPPVLSIHLKRFKYLDDVGRYCKLSCRVNFPSKLRLPVEGPAGDEIYRLFAVVVHRGAGPSMGHYICAARSKGSWAVFDDDIVYPISEYELSHCYGADSHTEAPSTGYLLFYALPHVAVPLAHTAASAAAAAAVT